MSVIAENTAVAEPTAADAIAAHNAAKAEEGIVPLADQEEPEADVFVPEDEPEADLAAAAPAKEAPAEGEEEETKEPDEPVKEAAEEADADVILFDPATDTPETYAEKKAAVLESYGDNLPADIKSLIEYNEAKTTEAVTALAEIDAVGNKETVIKLTTAFDKVYDTEIEDGKPVANVKPVNELLRSDYRSIYSPLAEAMFGSDSLKYQGHSVFEEILVDKYGEDKVRAIGAFLDTEMPLPTVPAELSLPVGVNPASKEAYYKLPEVKRFELQSLVENIATLEGELADASDYEKDAIQKDIGKSRELLKAEIYAIEQIQGNLNATRERQAAEQRYAVEQNQLFRNTVNEEYNTELFTMADAFAKDLAPRLTYADTDTQLSQARNVMSRVQNALAFLINDDGSTSPDPMADFYGRQLLEEGLKFDFNKGRDLLAKHYQATEKVLLLKNQRADPNAIEKAERNKRSIMLDINAEQKQLLGQLSAKYVKSNGAALGKQIDKIKGTKQIAKAITKGKPVNREAVRPVADEIAEYNRKRMAEIRDGDDLYEANVV